jgi:hypothetical protein
MSAGSGFTPAADAPCYAPRMTRAAAMALRTAGTLRENCVVVITDGPAIGPSATPTEIELNPESPTELGLTARVHTTYDDSAWHGQYDIDTNLFLRVQDNRGNDVRDSDDGATIVSFPWGNAQYTENTLVNSTLTAGQAIAAPVTISRNTIKDSTLDLTGWVAGSMSECEIEGPGSKIIGSGGFAVTLIGATIDGSATLNLAGRATIFNSRITGQAAVRSLGTTAPGSALSITSGSVVSGVGTILTNNSELGAGISVTNGIVEGAATLLIDAASPKTITVSGGSTVTGSAALHVTGAGTGSILISSGSMVSGKPAATDSILVQGTLAAGSVSISRSTIVLGNAWTIDGMGGFSVVDGVMRDVTVTKTAAAAGSGADGTYQSNLVDMAGGQINFLGPTRITLTNVTSRDGIFTVQPAVTSTGFLQVTDSLVTDFVIEVTSGPRPLTVQRGQFDGLGPSATHSYIRSSSPQGGGALINRVDNCEIVAGGRIDFSDTAGAPVFGNGVSYSKISGNTLGTARVLINGDSDRVFIANCEILDSIFTVTDAVAGAFTSPTCLYNLHLEGGASFLVQNPSGAASRQFRDMRLYGRAVFSAVNTSGGPNFDVNGIVIDSQCQLNLLGAIASPVRDVRVETRSIMNINIGGAVQTARIGGECTVNTGAFTHFYLIIELNGTHTLTAANINRQRNKGYSDIL